MRYITDPCGNKTRLVLVIQGDKVTTRERNNTMSQHHKSDIRLGYDAKVDHVYFDTTDEGTVEFGFRTKIGTRFDDKVFIYNNLTCVIFTRN